jgi:3-hydroxyisobutyrate dehydrogenase-like beta-hydroxyacid dehydrogenase
MGAHEGTLAVMVGGDDDAVERCRPVFDRFASMVQHMGPVGAGTRTKIARNLITFASFAASPARRNASPRPPGWTWRSWATWCGTPTG